MVMIKDLHPWCFVSKGEGLRITQIGLVNQGKFRVNEQKHHSSFLRVEHFYFQDRHLFFYVGPLLLCYNVLNMGMVALFWCFTVIFKFLIAYLTKGAQPPYKTKFWQCWDWSFPIQFYRKDFVSKLCPLWNIDKKLLFGIRKCWEINPPNCRVSFHDIT